MSKLSDLDPLFAGESEDKEQKLMVGESTAQQENQPPTETKKAKCGYSGMQQRAADVCAAMCGWNPR